MAFTWITSEGSVLGPAVATISFCWTELSQIQFDSVRKNIDLIPLTCLDMVVYVPNVHLLPDAGPAISLFDITVGMEFTWTLEKPYLLCAVIKQILGICWAIAYVRQLEFLLKKNWMMALSDHLSIQDFVDRVPKDCLFGTGGAIDFEEVGGVLLKFGVLLESQCRLESPERIDGTIGPQDTFDRLCPKTLVVVDLDDMIMQHGGDAHSAFEEFHQNLQNLIKREGIVSVYFRPYPSYNYCKGIYFPTEEEMSYPIRASGHLTLAVGSSHDEEGRLYYLVQESWGTDQGVEGYTRIYANVVISYVEMSV